MDNVVSCTHSALPLSGKDEMNLCALPLARLGKRDTRRTIGFQGEIVKAGRTINQTWTVRSTTTCGLPTEFAERVLVALISLAAIHHFHTPKTCFTIYGLLKYMGLSVAGSYYRQVLLALTRLHHLHITGTNIWWDHDKQIYRSLHPDVRLFERVGLATEACKSGDGAGPEESYVVWSPWIWESFQAGYVKSLDMAFYGSIRQALARRLFRFLDKRMHYRNDYQIDIFALASRLGMASYAYPSKIAEKLQPALDELIARDYLRQAHSIHVGKYIRMQFVRRDRDDHDRMRGTYALPGASLPSLEPLEPPGATKARDGGVSGVHRENGVLEALYAHYATSEQHKDIWRAILHEYATTLPFESYRLIADSALLAVRGDEAVMAVHPRHRDWIERQMQRIFLVKLSLSLGERIRTLQFIAGCAEES